MKTGRQNEDRIDWIDRIDDSGNVVDMFCGTESSRAQRQAGDHKAGAFYGGSSGR